MYRMSHEFRHKCCLRLSVYLSWRSNLLYMSLVCNNNFISNLNCLILIMSNEYTCDSNLGNHITKPAS